MVDDGEFEPDDERVAFLREIAEDVARESSESKQLSAILYRVSDLYDEDEEATPKDIYLNAKNIFGIKEAGGMRRV